MGWGEGFPEPTGYGYVVQAAWDWRVAGLFQIGTSKIGSTDVITADFSHNAYDDIEPYVKKITIKRGRSSALGAMEMGTATLVLKDPTGLFNPENSKSALAGKLVPMKAIRIIGNYVWPYGLFFGFIRKIEHDPRPNVQETVIECVDLFSRLYRSRGVIGEVNNYTVGQIWELMLDEIKWVGSNWLDLDADGSIIPAFSTDGSLSLLGYGANLQEIDLGLFFIAGDGKATYRSRASRWRKSTPVATLDDDIIDTIKPGISLEGIINIQTVTKTGGTPQQVVDWDSRHQYGDCEGDPIESEYLASDTAAASLATFMVVMAKSPINPVRRVGIVNADGDRINQILQREIGDLVTVSETRTGTSVEGIIESIEHIIVPGIEHRVNYGIRRKLKTFITIGASQIGSTDIVGY